MNARCVAMRHLTGVNLTPTLGASHRTSPTVVSRLTRLAYPSRMDWLDFTVLYLTWLETGEWGAGTSRTSKWCATQNLRPGLTKGSALPAPSTQKPTRSTSTTRNHPSRGKAG